MASGRSSRARHRSTNSSGSSNKIKGRPRLMDIGINAIVALLILGMTYALASEGLWGACLMFFNVLFGGLIAFNFYEPLARLLSENVPLLSGFADTFCLMTLFIVSTFILRLATETLGPAMVRFPSALYH